MSVVCFRMVLDCSFCMSALYWAGLYRLWKLVNFEWDALGSLEVCQIAVCWEASQFQHPSIGSVSTLSLVAHTRWKAEKFQRFDFLGFQFWVETLSDKLFELCPMFQYPCHKQSKLLEWTALWLAGVRVSGEIYCSNVSANSLFFPWAATIIRDNREDQIRAGSLIFLFEKYLSTFLPQLTDAGNRASLQSNHLRNSVQFSVDLQPEIEVAYLRQKPVAYDAASWVCHQKLSAINDWIYLVNYSSKFSGIIIRDPWQFSRLIMVGHFSRIPQLILKIWDICLSATDRLSNNVRAFVFHGYPTLSSHTN